MFILLVAIGAYSIGGYLFFFYWCLLVAINGSYSNGYWWY